MKCLGCGKDVISAGTKPKLYCSDACRKAFSRKSIKNAELRATGQTDEETDEETDRIEQTDTNGHEQTDKTRANGQMAEQTDIGNLIPYDILRPVVHHDDSILPADVKQQIDEVCTMRAEGGLPDDKANRTKRAIHYQEWLLAGRP